MARYHSADEKASTPQIESYLLSGNRQLRAMQQWSYFTRRTVVTGGAVCHGARVPCAMEPGPGAIGLVVAFLTTAG